MGKGVFQQDKILGIGACHSTLKIKGGFWDRFCVGATRVNFNLSRVCFGFLVLVGRQACVRCCKTIHV